MLPNVHEEDLTESVTSWKNLLLQKENLKLGIHWIASKNK